jgi:hypothetical protein
LGQFFKYLIVDFFVRSDPAAVGTGALDEPLDVTGNLANETTLRSSLRL